MLCATTSRRAILLLFIVCTPYVYGPCGVMSSDTGEIMFTAEVEKHYQVTKTFALARNPLSRRGPAYRALGGTGQKPPDMGVVARRVRTDSAQSAGVLPE
ncbi:hypothetical protein BDZ89DRAFT_1064425 [Hymenopellis radicata]|nr:hypothetical protein BDZ89DRAFT_1064425 [Hymenopellis radicata]